MIGAENPPRPSQVPNASILPHERAAPGSICEVGYALPKAERPVERYKIGNIATVRGGFYKELCDYTAKIGTVDAEMLCKEFVGRQINGRGINAARVDRYIRYALNHGQFKVAK